MQLRDVDGMGGGSEARQRQRLEPAVPIQYLQYSMAARRGVSTVDANHLQPQSGAGVALLGRVDYRYADDRDPNATILQSLLVPASIPPLQSSAGQRVAAMLGVVPLAEVEREREEGRRPGI